MVRINDFSKSLISAAPNVYQWGRKNVFKNLLQNK